MINILLTIIFAISIPLQANAYQVIAVNKIARVSCYNDYGRTASGLITYPGIVATSDYSILMKTPVYIEGYGMMSIADRTANWIGNERGFTLDIYDPNCTKNFGIKILSYTLNK